MFIETMLLVLIVIITHVVTRYFAIKEVDEILLMRREKLRDGFRHKHINFMVLLLIINVILILSGFYVG